ncbi:exonuclease domain-containing protein [Aliidiomarina soli]|uniref:3'-5' exonuclease n=1 Tax=Aliidiomarina soli TaxID=1928574 RepID=A0A432WCS9_9GAMM|nr:exonuclease domain-containing protein [Aliidiomarina soli]RUO30212.1 3'-5' exonuclease [Aliidiomarina soli]
MLISLLDKLGQLGQGMQSNIINSDGRERQASLQGRWQQARYVALDLETDGLDPEQHRILAIGWVPLSVPRIALNAADYGVIQSDQPLSQSAVIHQLSEQDIQGGEALAKVLKRLAKSLDGAVLVAHHAGFDWQFLQRAFNQQGVACQPLALMDTLKLEQTRLQRQKDWLEKGELTLAACRQRYGLPPVRQHHALSDAVACAELFLAQAYKIVGAQKTSLKGLLRYSR